ncbi:deoxyribose-phosphate aldolase [Roseivirga pacifica]|uniref:deoxyribose-phosphate aldolase n=1 Tax=Roseivirga pacifica TaxID=1267423 RepID=UPI0020944C78|nr:deoxyribose-phosphate aldolase [Roseivirga pacifica]MCO6359729.1 deoxyribose-phosphate aldolase [Roseivirga pacifica]MCO6367099.1 deoxyribose-phosphate aldolase [Roseivirga pacifica]MCO6370369.1 deoxyribose-phosphate aldolase [Roseivirga pacifica]MCO6374756.1 deoxyribose-phosphate aldolase [Roseivirga pacifica]MCO6380014.1 deoxyribose-phosphate aldolase [Roseivirga pacifica]
MDINRYIEHTNLKPTLTDKDIDALVVEAKTHGFVGVCVPPFWVKKAAREIGDAPIQLVTVIGFPLGYQMTEAKIAEVEKALDDGANELDVVMNISAFKAGMPWAKIELAKCAKRIHDEGAMMKVILETAYLSEEEIIQATKMAVDAGTDFVKTSTGFAPEGAKVNHIKLMREHAPSNVGVKASGGIRTLADAQAMIDAGADRIGASAGVAIMKEWNESR